jgi:hypothetical protein
MGHFTGPSAVKAVRVVDCRGTQRRESAWKHRGWWALHIVLWPLRHYQAWHETMVRDSSDVALFTLRTVDAANNTSSLQLLSETGGMQDSMMLDCPSEPCPARHSTGGLKLQIEHLRSGLLSTVGIFRSSSK